MIFLRMSNKSLLHSIRNYCDEKNFTESLKELPKYDYDNFIDLKQIFEKTLQNESKNKLSFSYKVNYTQTLLKKRLASMNEKNVKSNASKKVRIEKTEIDEIPDTFFNLMDELRIDRKNAKKFYENPQEWSYVISDRKIFCTKKGCKFSTLMQRGCFIAHCKTEHNWGNFPCPQTNCKFESYSQLCFKMHRWGFSAHFRRF
jgi:hypothetical protein